MPTFNCPVCENDASVQRVSAVVAQGTATGSFSGPTGALTYSDGKVGTAGGYTTLSGTSVSAIARNLSLPSEPKIKGYGAASSILGFGVLLFLVATQLGSFDGQLCAIVSIPTMMIGGLWFLANWAHNQHVDKQLVAIWPEYIQKWAQLFYCHKHGIVFDPDTGQSCEVNQLHSFLVHLTVRAPEQPNSPIPGAMGRLLIQRRFVLVAAVARFRICLDGKEVCALHPGQTWQADIPAGTHSLSATQWGGAKSNLIQITTAAGRTTSVEVWLEISLLSNRIAFSIPSYQALQPTA